MVLYGTDFINSAMVATVAEIDSGSTLHNREFKITTTATATVRR